MKCIAYVSRTTANDRGIHLPTGLSEIVLISRKRNPASQITGIISYRQGQFFQVLEGPHIEIDNLMEKIKSDPRHEDLWVFLNVRVDKRSFDSWGVSVFDFIDQGPIFKQFVEDNQGVLHAFTEPQKKRIQPFIDIEKNAGEKEYNYQSKYLRLIAWPDLNQTSQPQLIMNLCIKLTKKPYPFDSLVTSGEFGNYEQVTQIIKDFELMGILTVTKPEPELETKSIEPAVIQTAKPNKFYSAVKRFLGMG